MNLVTGLLLTAAAAFAAGPNYSASSIVNAASNVSGPLAPNTIVSVYGTDLSWETGAVSGLQDGYLPYHITGVGTMVLVNAMPAGLFYVSPHQINFLLSSDFVPGPVTVQIVRDGRAGPAVRLALAGSAPAFFQADPDFVVATRPDAQASPVSRKAPARSGEIVILYATGLGRTDPQPYDREIPLHAAPIERSAEMSIWLDGVQVPRENILYTGAAPNFAGLYQINLLLPETIVKDPEIRIGFPEAVSPPNLRLPMN